MGILVGSSQCRHTKRPTTATDLADHLCAIGAGGSILAIKLLETHSCMRFQLSRRHWLKMITTAGAASWLAPAALRAQDAPKAPTSGLFNLSRNENQFGPSPKALAAAAEVLAQGNEYPLEAQARLRTAIAQRERVKPEQVLLGAGSADILTALANRLWNAKGGNVVNADPTFAIISGLVGKYGLDVIRVPWTPDYRVDLPALEAAVTPATRLVYICNPENPSGTVWGKAQLHTFCEAVSPRALVVIDEAYLDYAGDADEIGMIGAVRDGLNVLVLRTFSKAYGLAGMRVGYAVASTDLVASLSDYMVTGIGCGCSQATLAAALAAYQDRDYLADIREKNAASRVFLTDFLKRKGFSYADSGAGFVLFPVQKDAKQIAGALQGGFQVQISPRVIYDRQSLRVSMGRPEQMERLVAGLERLL